MDKLDVGVRLGTSADLGWTVGAKAPKKWADVVPGSYAEKKFPTHGCEKSIDIQTQPQLFT